MSYLIKISLLRVSFISFLVFSSNNLMAEEHSFFISSFGDMQEEMETAQEKNKKGVFIFFTMDACPWCQKMHKEIIPNPKIVKYFSKYFVNIEVNIEGNNEMVDFNGDEIQQKAFALKYKVRATPVLAFFNLDGKEIVRRTGPASFDDFMLLAKFVADETYKTTNFVKYKRSQKRKSRL
jgi:thioredoxin-related protein